MFGDSHCRIFFRKLDIRISLKNSGYEQIPQLSCSNSISLSDEFKL